MMRITSYFKRSTSVDVPGSERQAGGRITQRVSQGSVKFEPPKDEWVRGGKLRKPTPQVRRTFEQHTRLLNELFPRGVDSIEPEDDGLTLRDRIGREAHVSAREGPAVYVPATAYEGERENPFAALGARLQQAKVRVKPPEDTQAKLKSRMKQLIDTRKVPHEPAIRIRGDWGQEAAREVCRQWAQDLQDRREDAVSPLALSRVKALDYERRHRDEIPAEQRILSPKADKQDYYDAMVLALLDAAGVKDAKAVLDSYKKLDSTGLARQPATLAALASSAVGAAQNFTPDLTVKAALAGARFAIQGFTTKAMFDTGVRRLEDKGTEDLLTRGWADVPPSAKDAPDVLAASASVIAHLNSVKKNLRQIESALAALDAAHVRHASEGTTQSGRGVQQAREALQIAFAKFCRQAEVRDRYKMASESAKGEFRGNERYFYASYAGHLMTLTASLLSILTPTVIAGSVTGGIGAAAVVGALALYGGYRLSNAPSKDGEAKVRRAIVMLGKSVDLLADDRPASRVKRAQAYERYIAARNKSRWMRPAAKADARRQARTDLLAELNRISDADAATPRLSSRQNWEVYGTYRVHRREIVQAVESGTLQRNDAVLALQRLKARFEEEHREDFLPDSVLSAWASPMSARNGQAKRLLVGKVAETARRLVDFEAASRKAQQGAVLVRRGAGTDREQYGRRLEAELRSRLLNLVNFDLAERRLRQACLGAQATAEVPLLALSALAAVDDPDLHALYCGDATEQNKAELVAKKLTAGEVWRYTYTNAGSVLAPALAGVGVAATDVGVTGSKAVGVPLNYHYNDHKLALYAGPMAQPAGHLNAGDRAGLKQRELGPKWLAATARQGDPVLVSLPIASEDVPCFSTDDQQVAAALNDVVRQFRRLGAVPDGLVLAPLGEEALSGSMGAGAIEESLMRLDGTTAHHRQAYQNATGRQKLALHVEQAKSLWKQVGASMVGLPTQALAQAWLRSTRSSMKDAADTDVAARARSALAREVPAERSPVLPSVHTLLQGQRQEPPEQWAKSVRTALGVSGPEDREDPPPDGPMV